MNETLVQIRCPRCHKLAAEAAPGSRLHVKCVRCGQLFQQVVGLGDEGS